MVGWNDEQKLDQAEGFVVLKSPDKASDALAHALQEHVKAKLAPYKYPRWIEFRKDLPKTATGKIQRFKLRGGRKTIGYRRLMCETFPTFRLSRHRQRSVSNTAWSGRGPDAAPTLVLLHEGLGCVGLWGDFPERLRRRPARGVFVYSRAGYGQSSPVTLPRPLSYMHDEARETLPRLLDAIGFQRGAADRPQRRRLDRRDLRRQSSGSPRRRPRADRAAFLHRRSGHRLDRRGEESLRDRRSARAAVALARRRRQRLQGLERRLARSANSANGISPSSSPISACRC